MIAPGNLPLPQHRLTGRRTELANTQRLLLRGGVRVLTLTGTGGAGKTRLAMQLAQNVCASFEHGVFFVDLAPITGQGFVPASIVQALGLHEVTGQPLLETLRNHLRDLQLLLVLDNFEQVANEAWVVAELVSSAPRLKVLVTSRESLHLYAEYTFVVGPLELPGLDPLPSMDELTRNDAVRLFVERAVAAKPNFQLTQRNARAVAEICHRLDGLPLGIELAAARTRILPPEEMLPRLSNRLKILTGGPSDMPARQQTLRNTIAWSYELLSDEEKKLFARLAVFVGGRTLESIEEICGGEGLGIEVLDGTESLLWKNLMHEAPGSSGTHRLVMLETVHEFAREKLEQSGETDKLQRRHARYFLDLAERAEPYLRSADQATWMDVLEAERHNLRAALDWSIVANVDTDRQELGLRLVGALQRFWEIRGPLSEGRSWLERALELHDTAPTKISAKVFTGAGTLAFRAGDYRQASEHHRQALDLYCQVPDRAGIAFANNNLGVQSFCLGEYESATAYFANALALYRELADRQGIAMMLNNLGEAARLQNDYGVAATLYEEGLVLRRELGDEYGAILATLNLAQVADHADNPSKSLRLFMEAILAAHKISDRIHVAVALIGLGGLIGIRNQAQRAYTLFGAGEALLQATGASLSAADRAEHERKLTAIRVQSQDLDALARAWEEGRAMTIEQTLAYVAQTQEEPELAAASSGTGVSDGKLPTGWHLQPYGLTRRELQVLELVVKGLTDAQVADRLVLSVRTVETHLRSIYGKLDVATRTEAAHLAFEQQLV